MSRATLAKRAGVSLPTVARILTGREQSPRLGTVQAIAQQLGVEVRFVPVKDEYDLRKEQANRKAQAIAKMVQGTMGLEAQGVSQKKLDNLVRQKTDGLMAGSRRKLWE
jgi:transcriptional regulator with XRE-family HTH domain